jgi:uncharacterized protein YkwD
VPGRSDQDRSEPPTRGAGRHRHASRVPGPLGLALIVGILLLTFGGGAALLRPSLADDVDPRVNTAADGAGGVGGFGANSIAGTEAPGSTPTPAATASATPKSTPTPKATTPAPKRTTTKPKTTTKSATGGGSTAQSADENEVVEITNRERAAAGCGAVTVNAKLASAAGAHSKDQADHNTMSHTGSDGSSPWDRSERAGYSNAIGENVAAGYRTPAAVMDGWMNSDGHRANIENCDAKAIGVGLAYASDGTPYWTQMFGSVA